MRIKRENLPFLNFIPRDMRVHERIAEGFLKSSRVILIRAIPGSGKTTLAVAFAFWRALHGDRIAIFFRTRAEIDHALGISFRIAEKLIRDDINPPLVIPVGGKEGLCRFPPNNPRIIKWWCKILKCEYLRRRRTEDLVRMIRESRPESVREFFILAREAKTCPYFAYQAICKDAPIVLATHPYLVNDEFFERLGNRDILIVDEAHNLVINETACIRLEEYKDAKQMVRSDESSEIARYIIRFWREGKKDTAALLSTYESFLSAPGYSIRINDEIIKILPPLRLMKQRLISVRQIILLSSSLFPSNLYKTLFSQDIDSEMIIHPGLFKKSKKRFYAGLVIGLSSRYSERQSFVYKKYAEVIKTILKYTRRPAIIFTPSHEFAEKISSKTSLPLITEMQDGLEHHAIVSVARGRLAEGVDIQLRGEEPELLIIAGLPYPERDIRYLKIIEFYAKYYKLSASGLLRSMEIGSMVSALIQASGRVGRKKKGVIIIIDDRLMNLNLRIPIYRDLASLIRDTLKFLQS
mgnify:CR=1 FL=1